MEEKEEEQRKEQKIEREEIIEAIRKLKKKKAAGPDEIKNEVWINGIGLVLLLRLVLSFKSPG